MKSVFHKTVSLLMAFVVLFSTMSFTINMHYCGDTLVETALFHKAKGCGMEMQQLGTESCSVTKKNCCEDQQVVVDGQDTLHTSVDKISFEQQVFITTLVFTYLSLFDEDTNQETSYQDYKPPLVIRQLYKLDETYLI
ncbi:hypothetical protein [Mangrovimonas sp. YM274]|uniref:HYC_CC_PP family protein n=1 Tax=Mangrovimonas sp. YM274 TaxID=3070660 RepID=UPI0027DCC17D|nr:hypothetical protein [Mangrovimonas sp. YM274]WMI67755.1 hypothetical protein RBH95_11455 [Mangrovimonas sp. YM274]